MNKLRLLAWVFLVLPALAQAWPSFDRPDFVETDWTADDMVYNGVRMYIENIHCDCQYEKFLISTENIGQREKSTRKVS
ncbi:MAG: hypothetical protein IPK30_11085 [Cellvibrionales bacterium]|nr:hypothetical protein [Cellvibrionales bacterium]